MFAVLLSVVDKASVEPSKEFQATLVPTSECSCGQHSWYLSGVAAINMHVGTYRESLAWALVWIGLTFTVQIGGCVVT